LHIDSRGGGAAASDLIWREVTRLAAQKPVVAYLHDVAASGGYYIACAATRIVAQPATLTGSIGVVAGKLSFAGLLEKVGLHAVVLRRGAASAMLRASVDYSDEERRRLRAELDAMYGQFVSKVAAGRSLDPAATEASAQGRVWLGADARPRGLVDELGPVEAALRLARSLAGEVGARARIVERPLAIRRRSLVARLTAPAVVEELLALEREGPLFLAASVTLR
jgi:protease-4